MIPETIDTWERVTWKEELREAVSGVDRLLALLGLRESDLGAGVILDSDFPLRVPASFVRRMEPGNPRDPLLLQVLPLASEQETVAGFTADPLLESTYNPVPGIVHKYRGRALLITSPACAIHCRYCFRRHFPYADNNPGKRAWRRSLDYIAGEDSITEVILSGGDPLTSDDRHLAWLAGEIANIPHVRRLRIHTRLPVVIPQRVDDDLLRWLGDSRLQLAVVLHANHPGEIDAELGRAVARLRNTGATVLNQTVLLRGINDSPDALVSLSERLFSIGVLPYYLHMLDPVAGAHHFRVEDDTASALYSAMKSRLPGYLLPRLVRDVPGARSKVYIEPQNQ